MTRSTDKIPYWRALAWCAGALLLPLGATGFIGHTGVRAPAPRPVIRSVGPDIEAPWVQISPPGIVHSGTVNLVISYCDDSTLNASSRTITRDGATWALGYTTSTKKGCGAYATSSSSFTLAINGSTTITAAISDVRGNRGTASATITYVPTYTVTVTADSDAVTRQSDASTSQTFKVRNSGSEPATYTLTPTCTGGVNSCSAPGSVQVAVGQTATVAVSYHTVIGPATGTVSLQAVAQQNNSFTGAAASAVTSSALPSNVMETHPKLAIAAAALMVGGTAGVLGAEVGAGSTATFFRAVGQREAADIAESGVLRTVGESAEGKYLTNTLEPAQKWGELLHGEAARIAEVRVPQAAAKTFEYLGRIDGIGKAWLARMEQLKEAAVRLLQK